MNGLQIDPLLKYSLMLIFVLVTVYAAIFRLNKERIVEWLVETWNFSRVLLPYLFLGVFIAGFIMPIIPQKFIEGIVGQNTAQGNIIASVFGAFMYFSILTEIPILQAFIAKGMADGPVLALLLAGPSLSLPNMLVIKRVLGTEKTIVYVSLVVVYSTIAGLIFGSI